MQSFGRFIYSGAFKPFTAIPKLLTKTGLINILNKLELNLLRVIRPNGMNHIYAMLPGLMKSAVERNAKSIVITPTTFSALCIKKKPLFMLTTPRSVIKEFTTILKGAPHLSKSFVQASSNLGKSTFDIFVKH